MNQIEHMDGDVIRFAGRISKMLRIDSILLGMIMGPVAGAAMAVSVALRAGPSDPILFATAGFTAFTLLLYSGISTFPTPASLEIMRRVIRIGVAILTISASLYIPLGLIRNPHVPTMRILASNGAALIAFLSATLSLYAAAHARGEGSPR